MKTGIIKSVSIILSALMLFAGAGAGAYAAGGENKNSAGTETVQTAAGNSEHTDKPADADKTEKDETVYVLADADGKVHKIIVSDWIKNPAQNDKINDKTELSYIENVKGDESYTLDSENGCIWDAGGNDIYYQGNIEKELPVDINVSFSLDGKTVSASEIKGKSGKAVIRFEYKNKVYETVEINGKKEKIYLPFAMLTGVILDEDIFTNVEVTNGKIINDGSRKIAAGIAFPGLQTDLDIDKEKLEIPDYFEIKADVRNFELGNTLTVAANGIFGNFDKEALNLNGDMDVQLDGLTDAMESLLTGSSELYDGLCTLLNKSSELIKGIEILAAGGSKLKNGASELEKGTAALSAGAQGISDGLNELASNNDSLNAGARQVFESMLLSADAQLAGAGLTLPKLTIQNYHEVLNGVIMAIGEENAGAIIALMAQLDSYNQFYTGLVNYTAGVAGLQQGAGELAIGAAHSHDGAAGLSKGAAGLYDGILALQDGVPALTGGITALRDGAMQLSDGLKQFSEEGIQKLIDAADDIDMLITRINAIADVSESYTNFSGISDDMDGQVKFIYRTDSIKAE